MRVAQRTISRNYLNSLNNTLGKRAEALRRSEDGLRFTKLSDDVASGARAMDTQEMRYAAVQQKNTAEELLKELESVWTSIGTGDSIIQDVADKMKEAAGVRSEEKLAVIKQQIGALKEQYLQVLNTPYGGKYLFGGTNNASAPFTTSEEGKLMFNGVEVNKIYKSGGKYYEMAGAAPDPDVDVLVPQSGKIYLDVGLGLGVGTDGVDPRTAFQVNVVGLEIAGFMDFIPEFKLDDNYDGPQDKDEYEAQMNKLNNIYDLISEVEKSISPVYEDQKLSDLQQRLITMNDTMRMARTDVDTRANSLENIINQLEDDISGMEKLEDSLMTAQPAGEAIHLKDIEYSWKAILALGSQILPSSLLDYLR